MGGRGRGGGASRSSWHQLGTHRPHRHRAPSAPQFADAIGLDFHSNPDSLPGEPSTLDDHFDVGQELFLAIEAAAVRQPCAVCDCVVPSAEGEWTAWADVPNLELLHVSRKVNGPALTTVDHPDDGAKQPDQRRRYSMQRVRRAVVEGHRAIARTRCTER